jgi:hypothetical protein
MSDRDGMAQAGGAGSDVNRWRADSGAQDTREA